MSNIQTIAFYGATGGCALNALINTLAAGHTCRALARTPAKLTALLDAAAAPTANLSIIAGGIDDAAAVLSTATGASTIIVGVGSYPALSIKHPRSGFVTIEDPTVCERAMALSMCGTLSR